MNRSLRDFRFVSALLLAFAGASLGGCSEPEKSPAAPQSLVGPLGDRADLPVDEKLHLDNLSGPVDVVRDKYGRPHIYASNRADAFRAQGYLLARDRALQFELLRRTAEGRTAEIFGELDPSSIDADISFRHIGLHRIAKAQYANMSGDTKVILDAYADGITQAFRQIRSGELLLPSGVFGVPVDIFTDWTGEDSLAIGRLQGFLLSYNASDDIAVQTFFDDVRAAFPAGAADPLVAKRAGILLDIFRFAPATKTITTTDGYPKGPYQKVQPKQDAQGGAKGGSSPKEKPQPARPSAKLAEGYVAAVRKLRLMLGGDGFGSNNIGIMPEKSATGHVLIEADSHLGLSAPTIYIPISMHVTSGERPIDIQGMAFPGVPGIIVGHNKDVAWGPTVVGYDVSDAYAEELTPDGKGVKWKGMTVPLEVVEESIGIAGKPSPLVYKVPVVPHHGPIVPTILPDHSVAELDPAKGAISVRWTGLEPTDELTQILKLYDAKNVDDVYNAFLGFQVGGQNWIVGDTSGNVLWTSHARVPRRDAGAVAWNAATYEGVLPALVLPGDGTAEWNGYLDDALVPWVKNPAKGYIATANNDPLGDTLDNDPTNDKLPDGTPMYLASSYDFGFRVERLHARIEGKAGPLSLDDLVSIQADHHSPLGDRLVPHLLTAIERAFAESKSPGMHPDLAAIVNDPVFQGARVEAARALLDAWGTQGGYEASSGVDPDTNVALPKSALEAQNAQATLLFNAWLMRFFRRVFGDEGELFGVPRLSPVDGLLHIIEADPMKIGTYDPATGESALWDDMKTPAIESKDERFIRALLDAFAWIDAQNKPLDDLRWGHYHTVRFESLVPLFGALSIPPASDKTFPEGFPRHGDLFAVDFGNYARGVALDDDLSFRFRVGAAQRFVIDMDPAGVKELNAVPGGNIWDPSSKHFADQAEFWRRNQPHPVPFVLEEVVAAKESRIVFTSTTTKQ